MLVPGHEGTALIHTAEDASGIHQALINGLASVGTAHNPAVEAPL
jgi:hypothetical protein